MKETPDTFNAVDFDILDKPNNSLRTVVEIRGTRLSHREKTVETARSGDYTLSLNKARDYGSVICLGE